MAIHWRLRAVLDDRGITPLELARRLGVAHPSIYRLARQASITRITADMLDRLCAALDCTPGELVTYTRPAPRPTRKRKQS